MITVITGPKRALGTQNNVRSTEMPPALGGALANLLRSMSTSGLQPAEADRGFHRVDKMFELRKSGFRRLEYSVQTIISRSLSNADMRAKHLLQHDQGPRTNGV